MKAHYWIPESEHNSLNGPSRETLMDCVALFMQHGYLVLRNALPRNWVEQLAAAYMRDYGVMDVPALNEYGFVVGHNRVLHPLPLQGVFNQPEFYAQPYVYSLLMALLGPLLVLNNASVVVSLPEAEDQRLHRDNAFLFGTHPASALVPPYGITLGIPLVDLNTLTGSTCFYAGSHREIELAKAYKDKPGAELLTCRMGDVYLMDFRLVHGGTANQSPSKRPIIYLAYTQNWYFDIENTVNQHVPSVVMNQSNLDAVPEAYSHLLSYAKVLPRVMKPVWQAYYDKPSF